MIHRIGFACKLSSFDSKKGIVSIPEYNFKTTTISWLNRQSKDVAVEKLWDLLKHNLEAAKSAVSLIGGLDHELRLFRLGSDVLPAYTEPNWSWFWQQQDVRDYCARHFAKVGEIARQRDVRLSFHPGQFVVLASDNPDIVTRSIEEFEYHIDMVRWMNFGKTFQDFKVNVHIAGRAGPAGIIKALSRLSPEARNCITIENDEMTWGIDASLELADHLALVLDIHHHHIHSGEYIEPSDSRISRIIDSWRGVRPVIHYSTSREDVLVDHPADKLPDLQELLKLGYKKSKLRAHSDYMWNTACNKWALEHNKWADILVEAKGKNLASAALYQESKNYLCLS